MQTLFLKFRQFLANQNGVTVFSQKKLDKKLSLLRADYPLSNASTCTMPRAPGEGRRSNRDRKPRTTAYSPVMQYVNTLTESESPATEKAEHEADIRKNIESFPKPLKYAYLTLLDAILTQSDHRVKNECIEALHLTVLNVFQRANDCSS